MVALGCFFSVRQQRGGEAQGAEQIGGDDGLAAAESSPYLQRQSLSQVLGLA